MKWEKHALESINISLNQAEERISEIEDGNFKFIQSEENKEKRMKKE